MSDSNVQYVVLTTSASLLGTSARGPAFMYFAFEPSLLFIGTVAMLTNLSVDRELGAMRGITVKQQTTPCWYSSLCCYVCSLGAEGGVYPFLHAGWWLLEISVVTDWWPSG